MICVMSLADIRTKKEFFPCPSGRCDVSLEGDGRVMLTIFFLHPFLKFFLVFYFQNLHLLVDNQRLNRFLKYKCLCALKEKLVTRHIY